MDRLSYIYRCVFGPQLYRSYRGANHVGTSYEPNSLESFANMVLGTAGGVKSVCVVLSPVILSTLYRRGWFTSENVLRFGIFLIILYGGSYFIRAVGRLSNPQYLSFLETLSISDRNSNAVAKRDLQRYDFEMWAWPADYQWRDMIGGEKVKPRIHLTPLSDCSPIENPVIRYLFDLFCYISAHTIGRRLLYPGSVGLLNSLIHPQLIEGRRKLVEEKRAARHKLVSKADDQIDTIFVDRRNSNDSSNGNGNILVIGCEGNAGFYEVGTIGCPLEAGYSVLGWNHPGFGQSSGTPWPVNNAAAIDVTIQFATQVLGFDESDIIIYAWSIGGYPASWAAMNYPNIRGLLLDATFDDLVQLGQAKMPKSWRRLVHQTTRRYLDLPVSQQLSHYLGPVLLIRRTRDEIICTEEHSPEAQLRTNRATPLLKNLLRHRYPVLMSDKEAEPLIERWLNANEPERMEIIVQYNVDEENCCQKLVEETSKNDQQIFPSKIGENMTLEEREQLVIFLTSRYMVDFDSTHNTPLPSMMFRQPMHPWQVLID